jgi:hypothetical protein
MPLGGSKLAQPQRFSVVFSNAIRLRAAQAVLPPIKVVRCSKPIQRNSWGFIPPKACFSTPIQLAEHALPVSAALP